MLLACTCDLWELLEGREGSNHCVDHLFQFLVLIACNCTSIFLSSFTYARHSLPSINSKAPFVFLSSVGDLIIFSYRRPRLLYCICLPSFYIYRAHNKNKTISINISFSKLPYTKRFLSLSLSLSFPYFLIFIKIKFSKNVYDIIHVFLGF